LVFEALPLLDLVALGIFPLLLLPAKTAAGERERAMTAALEIFIV
jgi:hypothetical protein